MTKIILSSIFYHYFLSSKCSTLCTCKECKNIGSEDEGVEEEEDEESDDERECEESGDEKEFEERWEENENEDEERNYLDIFVDENEELFEEF